MWAVSSAYASNLSDCIIKLGNKSTPEFFFNNNYNANSNPFIRVMQTCRVYDQYGCFVQQRKLGCQKINIKPITLLTPHLIREMKNRDYGGWGGGGGGK